MPVYPSLGHAIYALGGRTARLRRGLSTTLFGAFRPDNPLPQGGEPDFVDRYALRYGIRKEPGDGQLLVESALSEETVRRAIDLGIFGDVAVPATAAAWREALTDLAVVAIGSVQAWTWMEAQLPRVEPEPEPTPEPEPVPDPEEPPAPPPEPPPVDPDEPLPEPPPACEPEVVYVPVEVIREVPVEVPRPLSEDARTTLQMLSTWRLIGPGRAARIARLRRELGVA